MKRVTVALGCVRHLSEQLQKNTFGDTNDTIFREFDDFDPNRNRNLNSWTSTKFLEWSLNFELVVEMTRFHYRCASYEKLK